MAQLFQIYYKHIAHTIDIGFNAWFVDAFQIVLDLMRTFILKYNKNEIFAVFCEKFRRRRLHHIYIAHKPVLLKCAFY